MATRFWVGGTGTWDGSDTSHWSATSGGGTGASVPTTSDTVTFNSSSGTGTCTIAATANCSTLTSSSANITIVTGANIINLAATSGTIWNWTGGTFTGGSSTIVVTTAATGTRTFAGGGQTGYGTLTYTVANSPGILSVTGNNTWAGTWNIGPGRIVQCPSGGTQTFTAANALGGVAGTNNGYVRFPGDAASNASVPDIAAYTGAGIMRLVVRCSLDSWATNNGIISKYTTAGNRSWELVNSSLSSGSLQVRISSDGTTQTVGTASSAHGIANGAIAWVGVEYNTGTGALTFYKAADTGSNTPPTIWTSWTQISTSTVTAFVPFDSTVPILIGTSSSTTGVGNFYRAQLYTSTTTLALDADFTTKAFGANTFTESSSNAATVTINGALAQAGDGRVTLQAASGTTTMSLTNSQVSVMRRTVPDHVIITPAGHGYALDSVDGGNNTGVTFQPFGWGVAA